MRELRRLIPSLNMLMSFEAAARHLSFTRAASELHLTQPAVSHAIRQLENQLGVALFERRHRALLLTPAGQQFFDDVSLGLSHIYRSARTLPQLAGGEGQVTLSVSNSFATFWLLPRVARFNAAYPDIDLRVQASDRDLDLAVEGIELAVRYGEGGWPGYDCDFLVSGDQGCVCSPDYLAQHGPIEGPADLLRHPLIHLEEQHRHATTWKEWLAHFGLALDRPLRGLKLNDYTLVLKAVQEGQGVATGWLAQVQSLLDRGELVQPFEAVYPSPHHFYIVSASSVPLGESAQAVRDWLLSEGGSEG